MWVYFNVPEAEYINYTTQRSSENCSARTFCKWPTTNCLNRTALLKTIEADFNNETGNIAFRATFNNPTRLLRHGETGKHLYVHANKKMRY
jgi:membrane fusion protein (multidrug efflux system)